MLEVITVTSSVDEMGFAILTGSLLKQGWRIHALQTQWSGFSTKLIETYNYLKRNPEVTEFIFCDAFDVVCLGSPEEFLSKLERPDEMLLSAERGLWPPTMEQYKQWYEPILDHGFNYVNSGLYYSPASLFIQMMERNMPEYENDDQEWLTLNFLFNHDVKINLDRNCDVFQSYSFVADDDYSYGDGRLKNLKTYSLPVFVHGNGRSDMRKVYDIMGLI
jgi:hypothetical protein